MKLDPLLLIPAILRFVKRVLQQINNLGVCFYFFLITASQSITDELRETQDACKSRNCPSLCEAFVDCRETRLAHSDGFARAFPPDGGLSGPNYQLLRAFHEHHQHQHEYVLSWVAVVLRSALFGCEARPFASLPPGRPYSLCSQ